MRVAIAAESFLPQVNGVVNSVLRLAEYISDNGHEGLIIAPSDYSVPKNYAGLPVKTIPAIPFPWYQDVRVSLTPNFVVERILSDFAPDVLHAASPFLIGSAALAAAAHFSIPSVAVYQTDIPSYAKRYRLPLLERPAWARMRDIHALANLTLAPSTQAAEQLRAHGLPRVKVWGRGVDTVRFSPDHRDQALHDSWAPDGEVVVGYMGRIAAEKQVSDLAVLAGLPGAKLVVVGDGPTMKAVQEDLPEALFVGKMGGQELATATASLDVFVHPGELETFGQAIQEALASGVPVVAPAKGGPVDLIESGNWGFLYPPGDLAAMREMVAQLVGDEPLRRRFAQRARDFTVRRTWPVIMGQLFDHYREAMAMTAGAVPDLR